MSIRFELHRLGWDGFQQLVGTIFREVLGQTLVEFSFQHDGGRDMAFRGTWASDGMDSLQGNFTIQCKHTSIESAPLSLSSVSLELNKVARLADEGLADVYILVTNHRLTGTTEEEIRKECLQRGASEVRIYGYEWVVNQITSNPNLRRLVPRLYGLGDLTQIITHNAFEQAQTVLHSMSTDLECFVVTEAYRRSARALTQAGFVLLLGEPASGKSTIASILALSAADQWKLQTLMISSPESFDRLWNPNDPGQFFWIDDAFGSTQYDPRRVQEWNQRLAQMRAAIQKGAWVVMTSRNYIFNAAIQELRTASFDIFDDPQLRVYCEKLTDLEKSRILYNHLKFGAQSKEFRTRVKPWLHKCATAQGFLPETARRFGNPMFTRDLRLSEQSVHRFFDKPVEYIETLVTNLASSERAALALVFCSGGRLRTPIEETSEAVQTANLMRSNLSDVRHSLVHLNGSLVRREGKAGEEYWCFKHPTVHDAFSSFVGSNPELIDIYLKGTNVDKIIAEVSCGVIPDKGIKINVPKDRYSMLVQKMKGVNLPPKRLMDPLMYFLADRCDQEFLEVYFRECMDIATLPNEIAYFDSIDGVLRVLLKLHSYGLLDEHIRETAARRITEYAVQNLYTGPFDSDLSGLLKPEELHASVEKIALDVAESGSDLIDDVRYHWDPAESPSSAFRFLSTTLDYLVERIDDEELLNEFEALIGQIDDEIYKMTREAEDFVYNVEPNSTTDSNKRTEIAGIFGDIDE